MEPTPESRGVEVFDPRGDLRLVVGADQVVFQVCSRALARSSPVWEKMLYGSFAEGKAQQEGCDWEIPLPEDRPEGLRTLCVVVHSKFDELPLEITHDELRYLTVLADKYDMTSSLKPFWRNWVKDPDSVADSDAGELLDYLSVYYNLGHGRGFRKAFGYFVTRVATYDDRLYIDGFPDCDLYTDSHLCLQDTFEDVKKGRKTLLKIICIKIKNSMESLILRSRCKWEYENSTTCDCVILGALVKTMASRRLDHWFSSRMEGMEDSITHSVSVLSSLLSKVRLGTVAATGWDSWPHADCSPWALEDEKYGKEGTVALEDLIVNYQGHLKKKAEKSGLNPEFYPG
ncbi:hypothetical protein B0I37DRAFT_188465 [Chaetomium sp. MPI-CAGE-AT-0009]|nr:hypothetical protein B0I37DRAFT_188465 [Chaetomium sp. MPI-CAGE-AT-0009]